MPFAKVVLVNDEKSRLEPLREILKQADFEVVTTCGSFAALAEIAGNGADLIITASHLPDLDGNKLACLIKSNETTHRLPVILVKETRAKSNLFWSQAAQSDALINLSDAKEGDELSKLCHSLIEQSRTLGWRASYACDARLMCGTATHESLASFKSWMDNLLIERLTGQIARSLMADTTPRKRFLDRFFATVSQLFDCQLCGIAITSTAAPWSSIHLSAAVGSSSVEKLIQTVAEEVNGGRELSVDLRGTLPEEGGQSLKTVVILPVRAESIPLGALIFASSAESAFDETVRRAAGELQIQMMPLFHLLAAYQKIDELHQQEHHRASIDTLTGLYNIEFLVGFLQQQLLFSFRQRLPVGLLLVDIDHLQSVNDEFGYELGDLVLSTLSSRLLNLVRSSDLLARYGGDEIAIVLPNTDAHGTTVVAEKLRLEVEQMTFIKDAGRKDPHITVSIGCASFNMEDLNPETILRDAKVALKKAQTAGPNKVSL